MLSCIAQCHRVVPDFSYYKITTSRLKYTDNNFICKSMGVPENKSIFAVWNSTNVITAQLKMPNLPLKRGPPRTTFFDFPLFTWCAVIPRYPLTDASLPISTMTDTVLTSESFSLQLSD